MGQRRGYDVVATPGKRTRAGCLAHARRKIFEANYRVERAAKTNDIVGTDKHLELRRAKSRSLRRLRAGPGAGGQCLAPRVAVVYHEENAPRALHQPEGVHPIVLVVLLMIACARSAWTTEDAPTSPLDEVRTAWVDC